MSKKQIVGSMSEWSGVLKDFFRQIDDGSIGLEEVQTFLEHKNPFGLLYEWERFYQSLFGIKTDFLKLQIPKRQKGFDRLIVVAQGMTPQRLYDKCAEMFPCWKWTNEDLDKIVQSERTAKDGVYAVWFRDTVEADGDLKNLSANDLRKKNIPGITLEERFLMELKYCKETEEHLDIMNVTLCSGSRYSGGSVPRVDWGPGGHGLGVRWCRPEGSGPRLRSRRAVL